MDVRRSEDGRNDADAVRPGFPYRPGVLERDPTDANDGEGDACLDAPDPFETEHGQVHSFRRCPVNRGRADIIGALALGVPRFFRSVDGNPDEHALGQDLSDNDKGHVVLAEMNAGRAAGQSDVGPVVDDERDMILFEDRHRSPSKLEEIREGEALSPQLDDGGAASNGRFDETYKIPALGIISVGHQVERIIDLHPLLNALIIMYKITPRKPIPKRYAFDIPGRLFFNGRAARRHFSGKDGRMAIDLKSFIIDVPDFPKPGIVFKDILPIVQNAAAFNFAIDELAAWAGPKNPGIIAGIESRGFLFAAGLARELRLGLSVIRKQGKLPRRSVSVAAPNEYAVEHFEMHEDALAPRERVIIIDDLIATGSSSTSAINLVSLLHGEVIGFGAVVELGFLKGVENIRRAHPGMDIHCLVRF